MKIVRKNYGDPPIALDYVPGDRGVPAWLKEYREKLRYVWFWMECGHGSDITIQERYGAFRPRKIKDKYWCDECGKWRKKVPPPAPPPQPDDPAELF